MNRERWMVLVLILVLMVACGREPAAVKRSATPVADETKAPAPPPAPIGVTILVEGVVQNSRPPMELAFETGGVLLAVNVETGDRVELSLIHI